MKAIAIIFYLIFAAAVIGFYHLLRHRTGPELKPGPYAIRWILAAGFIIRVILAMSIEGFSTDIGLFRFWSQKAAEDLFHMYHGDFYLDYPPGYLYVLFLVARQPRFRADRQRSSLPFAFETAFCHC